MGTSVRQIDATYGHLVPDSEEYLRGPLDDYDSRPLATADASGSRNRAAGKRDALRRAVQVLHRGVPNASPMPPSWTK